MTTKLKTVKYINAPIAKYSKDRDKMIEEGWKVLDVNLQTKERFLLGSTTVGKCVTGNIVYEKK